MRLKYQFAVASLLFPGGRNRPKYFQWIRSFSFMSLVSGALNPHFKEKLDKLTTFQNAIRFCKTTKVPRPEKITRLSVISHPAECQGIKFWSLHNFASGGPENPIRMKLQMCVLNFRLLSFHLDFLPPKDRDPNPAIFDVSKGWRPKYTLID